MLYIVVVLLYICRVCCCMLCLSLCACQDCAVCCVCLSLCTKTVLYKQVLLGCLFVLEGVVFLCCVIYGYSEWTGNFLLLMFHCNSVISRFYIEYFLESYLIVLNCFFLRVCIFFCIYYFHLFFFYFTFTFIFCITKFRLWSLEVCL